MATLIEVEDVTLIIDTELEDSAIEACIDGAVLICEDCDVTNTLMKELQRWVAAHLVVSIEGQVKSEGFSDGTSVSLMARDGYGLMNSRYGQAAVAMDTSGTLKKKAEGVKKGVIKTYYRGTDKRVTSSDG